MSWKCNGSCSHVSHSYTTEQAGVEAFKQMGYVLDGIEGYVFPHSKSPQPIGTVKLCRKYSEARDDYVLFAGTGPNGGTCGTSDGFTRDANGNLLVDYTVSAGGTDYIGYVYPVRAPQAVNGTPILSVLSLMALD
jgi:hypothetical protein